MQQLYSKVEECSFSTTRDLLGDAQEVSGSALIFHIHGQMGRDHLQSSINSLNGWCLLLSDVVMGWMVRTWRLSGSMYEDVSCGEYDHVINSMHLVGVAAEFC